MGEIEVIRWTVNLSALGLVAWIVRHILEKTLPRVIEEFIQTLAAERKQFSDELRKQRVDFQEELRQQRTDFRDELHRERSEQNKSARRSAAVIK